MRHLLQIVAFTMAVLPAPSGANDEIASRRDLWDFEQMRVQDEGTPPLAEQLPASKQFLEDGEPIFSQLGNNEVVTIEFESKGCFNAGKYVVKVRGGANPVAVVKTLESNSLDARSGKVRLSRDDLLALDRMFAYYGSVRSGYCTTTNKISFRWREAALGEQPERREEFIDSSCADRYYGNLLIVPDLILRLETDDAV